MYEMTMNINDIRVPAAFRRHAPAEHKLETCRMRYRETGALDRRIIVTENRVIKDGYVGYLVAREAGLTEVTVTVDGARVDPPRPTVKYVYGVHPGNRKIYCWKTTARTRYMHLLAVGNKAVVDTKFNRQVIVIVRVDDCAPDFPVSKKVIRILPERDENRVAE